MLGYYIVSHAGKGLYLTVDAVGTITDRTNVGLDLLSFENVNQMWLLPGSSMTGIEVSSANNPSYMLNARKSTWNCDVYTSNSDTVLNFLLAGDGCYKIQLNSDKSRYLTAAGTSPGSNVDWQTATSANANAQLWKLVETSVPDPPPITEKIDILVSTAESCKGFNLAQCAEYFGVPNPNFAWCAWFVRMCGQKAGLYFGSSNLANGLTGLEGNFDYSSTGIKVGDLAFIDTSGGSQIGHVGIVVEVTDTTVYTIEGNMSGSTQTSIVKRPSYSRSDGTSPYYGRIVKFGKNS